MRVPVVSVAGEPLMPTTPAKARKLLKGGVAKGIFNKLGVFYVQMRKPIGEETQEVKMTIDYGSKWDGYAVSGKKEACLLGMAKMPERVAKNMETRQNLRSARRFRLWRRKARFDNRARPLLWLAPSQHSKVDFRKKIVSELANVFPICEIGVEDIAFNHYKYRHGKSFSTAEIGKTSFYRFLNQIAPLVLFKGWETARLRKKYGISKSSNKSKIEPESHATDCIAMLSGMFGECPDYTNCSFWYWQRLEFARRALHRQNHQQGGIRPRFGGTTHGSSFRKGDYVFGVKKGEAYVGWVCGLPTDKTKTVGIADFQGTRIGQFSQRKTALIRRATGLSWRVVIPPPTNVEGLLTTKR